MNESDTELKKTTHPLISIIIPVYQVKPYLRACLDSVLSQSYTNWEMLLIDDGSTDGSGDICDEYASKDERIKVIHQENMGLSAARNTGLDNMSGEYICFIDSDDVLLTDDYLKILLNALIDNNADISMCNLMLFKKDEELKQFQAENILAEVINGKDIFRGEHRTNERFQYDAAPLKIFKKDCFDGIRFPLGKYIEYMAIAHLIVYPCERIAIIDEKLYGYRRRENSILSTSSHRCKLYIDNIDALSRQLDYFEIIEDTLAASRVQRRLSFVRGMYFVIFSSFGGEDDVPAEIRPNATDMESFPNRRWVDEILSSSSKKSAIIAKAIFKEYEFERTELLQGLLSAMASGTDLPKWRDVKRHLLPILDMAKEEGQLYTVCEALKQYDGLSKKEREKLEMYQNIIIRDTIRAKVRNK